MIFSSILFPYIYIYKIYQLIAIHISLDTIISSKYFAIRSISSVIFLKEYLEVNFSRVIIRENKENF